MNDLGNYLLLLSWALTLLAMFAGVTAARSGAPAWLAVAARSTACSALCGVLALVLLAYGFISNDYANQYVWQYSDRGMPLVYKAAAVWGGMDGSLFFWGVLLSLTAALVALHFQRYEAQVLAWFFAVANSSSFFYLTLVVFFTNPFRYLPAETAPLDGNGLNPLLQNPYMAVHPPLLYIGFTLLGIPYAFAAAALLAGRFSADYFSVLRRWLLAAWMFLTVGIILGAYWAYIELGWGGFWAWDPVENASLLPWLTCTALLHTINVEQQRGLFRTFNWILVVLTYALTVFATFITRSGIVQSVHAFGSSSISPLFVIYLVLIAAAGAVLLFWRRKFLATKAQIKSIVSREFSVLSAAILFLAVCAATVWGTMLPVFSAPLFGQKRTVDAHFYNTFAVPLLLLVVLLMAVGPFLAFHRTDARQLRRMFVFPLIGAAALALLLGMHLTFWAVFSYSVAAFVVLTMLRDIRPPYAAKKSRWPAHLVHLGVALSAFGITASMVHKHEEQFSLAPGQSRSAGGFNFTLVSLKETQADNYNALRAAVEVKREQQQVTVLTPELRHYPSRSQNTVEAALHISLARDVYLVLADLSDDNSQATFKLFINPFQIWLWIGSALAVIGTAAAFRLPRPARAADAVGESGD